MNTRVNVYFPPATYQELEALAGQKGMSKPGFIKHIFELYKVFFANKTLSLTDSAAKSMLMTQQDYHKGKIKIYDSAEELMAAII